jgi:hypothetical protein
MRSMIDFLNYEKHEIIMFVDYENNIYTKHLKMFSKKCVLENDFFVRTKHLKTFSNYFQGRYQTQENELVFQKMLFGK